MSEPPRRLRIVLADDHATIRQGLRLLIDGQPDMTVVAEAGDGQSAIAAVEQVQPDVVVMDISMPGVNGLNATRMLKEMHSESRVVASWSSCRASTRYDATLRTASSSATSAVYDVANRARSGRVTAGRPSACSRRRGPCESAACRSRDRSCCAVS